MSLQDQGFLCLGKHDLEPVALFMSYERIGSCPLKILFGFEVNLLLYFPPVIIKESVLHPV